MRTTNTRRHLTFGLMAAAGLAALLMLTAPPAATASVATQQRQRRSQQHQHHHEAHVPAGATVVEDADFELEIEPQDEEEVNSCPHFNHEEDEAVVVVDGDVEAAEAAEVKIDETKLGASLLVAGKEKGADAWKRVTGVLAAWARKAAPPASDAECDWSWSRLSCAPTAECAFKYHFGDWHLGRSCRLRTPEEKAAAEARALSGAAEGNKVVGAVRAVAGKVFGGLAAGKENTAKTMGTFLDRVKLGMKNAQPPSDDDCAFDVRASVAKPGLVCTPGCAFKPKLGDLSPNHACRRSAEELKEEL